MKKLLFISFFISALPLFAQEAIHNYGPMQMHGDIMVGVHSDFINDGVFEDNQGLIGFYRDFETLTISGSLPAIFFDAEIVVPKGLILENSIGVTNNGNLITGDIITPRSHASVYSNFLDDSFYTGESGVSKVNGYAALTNKESFIFPVGEGKRLRPLTIYSMAINAMAKCAYFFEDPNSPKTISGIYNTDKKATEFISISDKEFWKLEGDVPSQVTLSWDAYSNVSALGENVSDLKVVGWSKSDQQWVNLGNTAVEGGLDKGSVTSANFVPNDYEILTVGGNDDDTETFETLELANYYMTPNGDGQNDQLELDGLDRSPNNQLQIFDRYGVLVYSKNNYRGEFDGKSNRETTVNKGSGLPAGIYFYIITFNDLRKKHQGYLYLSN